MISIKKTHPQPLKGILPSVLAVLLWLSGVFLPGLVAAEVPLQESFSAEAGGPAAGQMPGKDGFGWRHPDVIPGSSSTAYRDYPVDLSGAVRGRISFDLQRLAAADGQAGTVFSLMDPEGNSLLRFQVRWTPRSGEELPEVVMGGSVYHREGVGLWSSPVRLDRPIAYGRWAHFDLVWDDAAGRYALYLDGRPQDVTPKAVTDEEGGVFASEKIRINEVLAESGEDPVFNERPFAWFLDRTDAIRVGAYYQTGSPYFTSPLTNAVLDNLEVVVNEVTSITSVGHDAFSVAGYSGKLVTGEAVTVTLAAGPGGRASFDIVEPAAGKVRGASPERVRISGVPMTEDPKNPGVYVGSYAVQRGDRVQGGRVMGRFTDRLGFDAPPVAASRLLDIDGTTHFTVTTSSDLLPADEASRAGITVVAKDANGRELRDRQLLVTLSTTGEYTGTVGGGAFEETVGGALDVDWGGVTDSFGEVTAQYISGFAAKTIVISAKDMTSGDVGVGWVRSYIDGTVDVVVKKAAATALALAGSLDVSLSRDWLTADGRSRSRITAVVKDADGDPVSGHRVQFTLFGSNGQVRVVQGKTDTRGRALADYIAGTAMGQVQIEVRDMTWGLSRVVSVELRPDAPAEITLVADPGEITVGEAAAIRTQVTDINGNPNRDVDVRYDVIAGSGELGAASVATDEDGRASVIFTGTGAGVATVRGTVISRVPTAAEISAAVGAVFLYGLAEDPGRLEVLEWLAGPGDEVTEGQALVVLEDRDDLRYTVTAPRDGILSVFLAEERDAVRYGDTLGYVIEVD